MLEITYDAKGIITDRETANNIEMLSQHFEDRMFIGAGTVMTPTQVELTKKAGGNFIISPDTFDKVINKTKDLGMVSIPGALTPTEIQNAHRFGADFVGKFGYSRISAVAGANSAESLRTLRMKYPKLFLLVDDMDYSGCNAKICSSAFDKFGHGAVICAGPTVTAAWQQAESDGRDFVGQAEVAAERMKKNLTRYVTVL
jgi:hypothetical protein